MIASYAARDLDYTVGSDPDGVTAAASAAPASKPKYKPGARAGHRAVCTRKDHVELTSPFDNDGLVRDWDLFETLLAHTLSNELRVSSREHALLLADPNHNSRKPRERMTELLFEKFETPAVYLARSAVLSAYANGRTTGLVLDIGYSGTSAVPVEDGMIVKGNSFLRTAVGGRSMNDMLAGMLSNRNVTLRPVWSYKRVLTGADPNGGLMMGGGLGNDEDAGAGADNGIGNIGMGGSGTGVGGGVLRMSKVEDLSWPLMTESFWAFSRGQLLEEVKAGLCAVNENPTDDLKAQPMMDHAYELPDGNMIELGADRFKVAEDTVFGQLRHAVSDNAAEARRSYVNQYMRGRQSGDADTPKVSQGLHGLVVDAIKLCDPSIHRDMYAGVCLTGGTSDLKGLFERLSYGLMEKYHKVRILAATGSLERKYCAWTGGSILATFSEHQKNWLSRSEFEENGSSFIHRKCQ